MMWTANPDHLTFELTFRGGPSIIQLICATPLLGSLHVSRLKSEKIEDANGLLNIYDDWPHFQTNLFKYFVLVDDTEHILSGLNGCVCCRIWVCLIHSCELEQPNYLGFVVFTSGWSLSLPNCVVNTSILILRGEAPTTLQITNTKRKFKKPNSNPASGQSTNCVVKISI